MFPFRGSSRAGQSLIEILVAIAVGTLMIVAALTVISPSLRSSGDASKMQAAVSIGEDLLEAAKVFADSNWHNVYDLQKTTSSKYFLMTQSSPYSLATGTESVSADKVSQGLGGYWKMDESQGNIIYDYSGANATGSAVNAIATTSCKVGDCRVFNGTNAYITLPTSTLKLQYASMTISAWIYLTSYATGTLGPTVISNTDTDGFALHINDGYPTVDLKLSGGTVSQAIGSSRVPLSTWAHVAMTYDGSSVRTYVNGALQGTAAGSGYVKNTANTNTCLFIGAEPSGCTAQGAEFYFPGRLDDVRVYSRALSSSEITRIVGAQIYNRYFTVENVNRDGSGNITTGAGSDDPSTQKITVTYGWPDKTSAIYAYVTRSKSQIFLQTDWSGGSGVTGPTTSTSNTFATSSNIDYSTTTGSIRLKGI